MLQYYRKDYDLLKVMAFLKHTLAVLKEQSENMTDVSFLAVNVHSLTNTLKWLSWKWLYVAKCYSQTFILL